MAYVLTKRSQRFQVNWKKPDGTPGEVQGDPIWESSHPEVATVTAEPGGAFAKVEVVGDTPVGEPARTTQLSAKGDADLGEGVRFVTATLDVDVPAIEDITGEIVPVEEATPAPVNRPRAQSQSVWNPSGRRK